MSELSCIGLACEFANDAEVVGARHYRELKRQNAELLEALRAFLSATEGTACVTAYDAHGRNAWPPIAEAGALARAVIAKAEGK